MIKIPFIIGAVPLYLTIFAALTTWWWLMSDLFIASRVLEGLGIAYLLPSAFVLLAYLGARSSSKSPLVKLSHFWLLGSLAIIFATVISLSGATTLGQIAPDIAPLLSIGFISGVMTIMTYPLAGARTYELYKKPLFLGGVIFMPLFITVGAILNSPLTSVDKGISLLVTLLGFWLSAAWLSSRRTQGEYVPGLEIRPMLPFRPDLMLPGGVNYVKGIILTGLGFMIMSQPQNLFPPPIWNWWGFVLAFWGIIALIPLRGIYKMVGGRRPRLQGDPKAFGMTFRNSIKEVWLFVGLLVLMYGFLNAFMGQIPFTRLNPFDPIIQPPHPLYGVVGGGLLSLSFALLVLVRGWYKTRLIEGLETNGQIVFKQVLLWIGTLLLIYAFVTLFMGTFMYPHPDTNPLGLIVGLPLFLGGLALTIGFRSLALRNELNAFLRIMPGIISDLPENKRIEILTKRLKQLAALSDKQRRAHLKPMFEGLKLLPEEKSQVVMKSQLECLATKLDKDERDKLMGMMMNLMSADS